MSVDVPTIDAVGGTASPTILPGRITSWLRRSSRWLTRRRIAVSIIVVVALVLEDIVRAEQPHSLTDFSDILSVTGLALVAMGVILRSWAAGVLQKNVALATNGPYRVTRNPLYFGSLLMTLGFCGLIGDWDNAVAMIALALILYWPKIRNEEAYLSQAFGDIWSEYAKETPRLIPHRLPLKGGLDGWRFRQWLANREYNALAGGCLGLAGIQLWFAFLSV